MISETDHFGIVVRDLENSLAFYRCVLSAKIVFEAVPLLPGDVITTGTRGAVVIQPLQVRACRIAGLGRRTKPVTAANKPWAVAQMAALDV